VFPIDWRLNDTYFVVSHFHYTLIGGAVFPIFSGVYYWFPKMSGRFLNERLGMLSFWLMLIGFNVTFLIADALGLSGMPRRIYTYQPYTGWGTYNTISTIGSYILALGVLVTIASITLSLKRAHRSGPTRGRATRSSGSRPHHRRSTTSTSSHTCTPSSPCATSDYKSNATQPSGRRPPAANSSPRHELKPPLKRSSLGRRAAPRYPSGSRSE
jgi:heme/copper-type cytochrome/quinol oxidase subunit 1